VALTLTSRIMRISGLGIAVVLALVGCSAPSGGSDGPGAASGEMRTVSDITGDEVEIPVDPQRVVALDEPAALNLLAIGITPDKVFQGWKTVVPAALLAGLGIEVLTTADYLPELEEVAALEPDLIVISTSPVRVGELPDYASIAPTLRAVFNAPPAELAQTWGGYFGKPERAEAIEEGFAELAAQIADEQPAPALSLSALESYGPSDSPMHMGATSSLHDVIDDASFDRPELQNSASDGGRYGGWVPFSPETLPDHDADIIAIKSSTQYAPEGITELPLFPSLGAAQSGQVVEVDGDFWSGGSLFYAYWVLADLHDFLHDDYEPGGAADAGERWEAFTTMIEG
jgi:ABC-type Fe3+-hydroxamate transport system substrate-binding protein